MLISRRQLLRTAAIAPAMYSFIPHAARASLSWPLKVTMARNQSGSWEVALPGGSYLDISQSKTEGLQEAIDHAASSGLGLEVVGGLDGSKGWADNAIDCKATVRIPPIQHAYWDFNGCALVFNEIGAEPGLFIDSVLHCNLVFRCVVVYNGTGSAVQIKPTANYHLGTGALFVDNSLYIERIRIIAGGNGQATGLELDGSRGAIQRSRIVFTEIEGDPTPSSAAMAIGVRIKGHVMANEIRVNALLHPMQVGFDVEGNGVGNSFHGHVAPYGPTAMGARTAGRANFYDLDIGGGMHKFGPGVLALASSSGEKFLFRRNEGNPPFINEAPSGQNRVL